MTKRSASGSNSRDAHSARGDLQTELRMRYDLDGSAADGHRAAIECLTSLGIVLLMEQLLLPYPDVTLSRIQVGTVLIYSNLWWLLYGVTRPN